MRHFISWLIAAVILHVDTAAVVQQTHRNPIIENLEAADPTVMRYEGTYYLYPTHGGRGYDALGSEDLVSWQRRSAVFVDRRGGVWAPDVFHQAPGRWQVQG